MNLNLLVIRSVIPKQLAEFYEQLGMAFEYHRHGNGPFHFPAHVGRSQAPSVSKGFHFGCEDIKATKRFIVYPGKERFPVTKEIGAVPILDMMNELRDGKQGPKKGLEIIFSGKTFLK